MKKLILLLIVATLFQRCDSFDSVILTARTAEKLEECSCVYGETTKICYYLAAVDHSGKYRCDELVKKSSNFDTAMIVIKTYGKALQKLADKKIETGDEIETVVSGLGDLKIISADDKTKGAINKVAKKVVGIFADRYKRKRLRQIIPDVDDSLKLVIDTLIDQLSKRQKLYNDLLNMLVDPMEKHDADRREMVGKVDGDPVLFVRNNGLDRLELSRLRYEMEIGIAQMKRCQKILAAAKDAHHTLAEHSRNIGTKKDRETFEQIKKHIQSCY